MFLVLGGLGLFYLVSLVHVMWEEKEESPTYPAGEGPKGPSRLTYSWSSYFPSNLLAAGIGVLYGLVIGPFLLIGLVLLGIWMLLSVKVLIGVAVLVIAAVIFPCTTADLFSVVKEKLSVQRSV